MRFIACLVAGIPAAALAQSTSPLTYVESSAGTLPPQWEGGRTTLAIADLNLDGHPDIVSIGDHGSPNINSQLHGVSVWFGNGAGAWTSFQTGTFGYGGVAVGDLNWDGKPDIAYGMHHDYSSTDFGDQLIEAALGDGTGMTWTPWDDGLATSGEDYGMFGVSLADFDADGSLDLISDSFGCCAGVHVYRNNTDGTWTQTFGFFGGNSTDDTATGDANNDGYPDFVVANQLGTVYISNAPSPGFTLADAGLPADGGLVGRRGPYLGDVNADGRDDLSYANSSGGVRVFLRTSGGSWADASLGLPASGYSATRMHDMNADGFLDLVAYRSTQLVVWAGNGGTAWTQIGSISVPTPGTYSGMAIADVDHKGYPDIALVSKEGSGLNPRNKLRVFKETTAAVTPRIQITAPTANRHVRAGSAIFVDWLSASLGGGAGTVNLEVSGAPGGPWHSLALASQLPDNGRHQVRIAANSIITTWCSFPPVMPFYLRATLQAAAGSAAHISGPFFLHACYADCTGDGNLTIADFGCFQTAFVTEKCDCTCSAGCTIADFACFQTAFVAGCP